MLAEQAGDHLNHFYSKNLQAELKADNTPVTEADLFVSQFLIEKLTALTPRLPVLSEESCKMPLWSGSNGRLIGWLIRWTARSNLLIARVTFPY